MLDDFLLFVEVARRGSFSKTAKVLRLTSPTLSKRISFLEDRLGTPLFIRSSRGLSLTSYGQDMFEKYANEVLEINNALLVKDTSLPSRFTLHCPQNLMQGPLYSALSQFVALPELAATDITLEPANANVLLSQTSFDMAIRVGKQKDSAYYQKAVGEIAVALVCSKACLSKEVLVTPYDKFPEHNKALQNTYNDFTRTIKTNDITVARLMVQDKMGVGLLPMTEVQQLLEDSKGEYEYMSDILFNRPVYALWPNTQVPTGTASLLLDVLRVSKPTALNGQLLKL
ncbi:LysR family transcriptional regulator [Paraglaciecola marina]|uniref:LysR family transcriptional regulator n=1 Tax=Paraglaciecola marina TaxID=2500157 RepID=UPI00106218F0|nr:LysR family transcriptional regulator [Paraglaciecola marina]